MFYDVSVPSSPNVAAKICVQYKSCTTKIRILCKTTKISTSPFSDILVFVFVTLCDTDIYELTKSPAHSWLDSSVDRTLYR